MPGKIRIRIDLDELEKADADHIVFDVDAQGFRGKACAKQTEKLLEGLNVKTISRKLKPEYNMAEETNRTACRV